MACPFHHYIQTNATCSKITERGGSRFGGRFQRPSIVENEKVNGEEGGWSRLTFEMGAMNENSPWGSCRNTKGKKQRRILQMTMRWRCACREGKWVTIGSVAIRLRLSASGSVIDYDSRSSRSIRESGTRWRSFVFRSSAACRSTIHLIVVPLHLEHYFPRERSATRRSCWPR